MNGGEAREGPGWPAWHSPAPALAAQPGARHPRHNGVARANREPLPQVSRGCAPSSFIRSGCTVRKCAARVGEGNPSVHPLTSSVGKLTIIRVQFLEALNADPADSADGVGHPNVAEDNRLGARRGR